MSAYNQGYSPFPSALHGLIVVLLAREARPSVSNVAKRTKNRKDSP